MLAFVPMLRASASLAALLLAPATLGNVAATPSKSWIGAPVTAARTPLEVRHERLRFECRTNGSGLSCSFDARYEIHNPAPVRQEVVAAFYSFVSTVETVTFGGADVRVHLTAEEVQALEATLAEVDRTVRLPTPGNGMRLGLDAGGSGELVVHGSIEPEDLRHEPGYSTPAVYARHPLLGARESGPGKEYVIDYYIAPLWTWAGRPDLEVEVVVPEGYRGGGKRVFASGTAPATLSLRIEKPAPMVIHGGPKVAVGGSLGDDSGLRLAAGWEVARPNWILYSIALETNARERHYVVPMVTAATDSIFVIIPSLGVGVGAPVEVAPDLRVGGRVAVDAHFTAVGLVTALDLYPTSGTLQLSLLGQLGL